MDQELGPELKKKKMGHWKTAAFKWSSCVFSERRLPNFMLLGDTGLFKLNSKFKTLFLKSQQGQ